MATPYAFFQKQIVPLEQAKVGVMTHALNYGTAVFEGIRGNWNAEEQKIYLFRLEEHYERLHKSAKIMMLDLDLSVEELCRLTVEVVGRCGYTEDTYVRPLVYKSSELLGVRLHNLETDIVIFATPFGNYLDIDAGARCCTSSWRRVSDVGIPARAKPTGIYINSALAKTEANLDGYDEAIMLSDDGHVSEGSGENIFVIIDGQLITPASSDNILVGITRASVMEIAERELGLKTIERPIDRSELYVADEVFMTGTAAHVTPVVEVDRRLVGTGQPGEITRRLSRTYFDAIRGKLPAYRHWVTEVPVLVGAS
jgi:branched-chain amino acid aminotransferase